MLGATGSGKSFLLNFILTHLQKYEPFTYVFDADGDKVRMVQFRGAGPVTPNSLFFGPRGTVLATPGLYEFAPE